MIDKDNYTPHGETAIILDRALDLVGSVPYRVSARWLFYRLLQEGYYQSKSDYSSKWLKAVSRARHASYKGWRPDTLADETREAIVRGSGFDTPSDWLKAIADHLACNLTKWHGQGYYLEMWIEARAMVDQFRHYTEHITIRPMGGQASIPYKYAIAQDLDRAAEEYGNPIVILYFGDLDTGGLAIEGTVEGDVRKWCTTDFEFVRCGLNPGQPEQFGIPDNPEKPGQYQWEALPDSAAKELIVGNVSRFVRQDAFTAIEAQEKHVQEWLRGKLAGLIGEYPGGTP